MVLFNVESGAHLQGLRNSSRVAYSTTAGITIRSPQSAIRNRKMDTGEFLTRATVWVSIVGYTIGSVLFALSDKTRNRAALESVTRVLWTIAWACLIAHFVNAFHFYHGWSHAAAYEDTARQTYELFGLYWGGGVFINYAVLVVWMIDIAWWWRSGLDSYRKRPWPLVVAWHGLFIFIIFNSAVVFGDGIVRWVGAGICSLLTLAWVRIIPRLRVISCNSWIVF